MAAKGTVKINRMMINSTKQDQCRDHYVAPKPQAQQAQAPIEPKARPSEEVVEKFRSWQNLRKAVGMAIKAWKIKHSTHADGAAPSRHSSPPHSEASSSMQRQLRPPLDAPSKFAIAIAKRAQAERSDRQEQDHNSSSSSSMSHWRMRQQLAAARAASGAAADRPYKSRSPRRSSDEELAATNITEFLEDAQNRLDMLLGPRGENNELRKLCEQNSSSPSPEDGAEPPTQPEP